MLSVDSGHGDVARQLLNNGADPDKYNKDGQSAADIAANAGRVNLQEIIETFSDEKGRRRHDHHETRVDQMTDLETELRSADLSHLVETCRNNNIDLTTFLLLRESDFNNLDLLNVGDCQKLMNCQVGGIPMNFMIHLI